MKNKKPNREPMSPRTGCIIMGALGVILVAFCLWMYFFGLAAGGFFD